MSSVPPRSSVQMGTTTVTRQMEWTLTQTQPGHKRERRHILSPDYSHTMQTKNIKSSYQSSLSYICKGRVLEMTFQSVRNDATLKWLLKSEVQLCLPLLVILGHHSNRFRYLVIRLTLGIMVTDFDYEFGGGQKKKR